MKFKFVPEIPQRVSNLKNYKMFFKTRNNWSVKFDQVSNDIFVHTQKLVGCGFDLGMFLKKPGLGTQHLNH